MNVTKKRNNLAAGGSKFVAFNSRNELPIIQQGQHILISAKLLHQKLKVKTVFANWFQRRIEKYGFEQDEDFFPNLEKSTGGRQATDYLLSIDMAKELAMLEENETGRAIRRYFIEKEKEARGISHLPAERSLFSGIKPQQINGRQLYPYRRMLERCGYSSNSNGGRRMRYPQHFVEIGNVLYITQEYALHLYHQKQVMNNRTALKAMQPVLALNFGEKGGASC